MKTIAVVQKNRCSFEKMEEYASKLLYTTHTDEERINIKTALNNYIWSEIEPFVKFIDIPDDDDFLTVVCENITKRFPEKKADEFFYHTEGSYSFPKKYIEFLHCQPLWKEYQNGKIENINNLGCLFSLKHHVIENDCIIFANKYDLSAPHFTVLDSVNKEDIIRVVRRRYFFSAILIKDDSLVKYYYQDPKYLITKIYNLTEKDNIQKMSFGHLKYNLVMYFQHDKSKYLNKIATRINGSYQLHGDVLLLHEMEENIFTNLSMHEVRRLNVLSYGRLYDRQLKDEEIHTMPTIEVDENGKEYEKKVTPIWSRYITLDRRMLKWKENKNKCINCYQEIKNVVHCEKCYRLKFCSTKCRKEFDSYHSDECINPKSI